MHHLRYPKDPQQSAAYRQARHDLTRAHQPSPLLYRRPHNVQPDSDQKSPDQQSQLRSVVPDNAGLQGVKPDQNSRKARPLPLLPQHSAAQHHFSLQKHRECPEPAAARLPKVVLAFPLPKHLRVQFSWLPPRRTVGRRHISRDNRSWW